MFISITNKFILSLTFVFSFLLMPVVISAQSKRIKPPKRNSKIKSVDQFVDHTFRLYNKVFVYDSLTQVGVEIPSELEDELVERAQQDVDSLWQAVPDIIADVSDASFMKKTKATFNLNKAKKALKYCGLTIKNYFLGKEEED